MPKSLHNWYHWLPPQQGNRESKIGTESLSRPLCHILLVAQMCDWCRRVHRVWMPEERTSGHHLTRERLPDSLKQSTGYNRTLVTPDIWISHDKWYVNTICRPPPPSYPDFSPSWRRYLERQEARVGTYVGGSLLAHMLHLPHQGIPCVSSFPIKCLLYDAIVCFVCLLVCFVSVFWVVLNLEAFCLCCALDRVCNVNSNQDY